MCDVYYGDVPSVIPDVHLVAFYFHYPVGFFLVFGFKYFGCVVHHHDEVPWIHWRFHWLLVVMSLHVPLSAIKKLLSNYRTSRSGIPLSSWKYLLAWCNIWLSLLTGSLPNIRKNADSLALQLGKKLYHAVAIGASSSHSSPWLICFVMQALRSLCNPSTFLLLCGLYGG